MNFFADGADADVDLVVASGLFNRHHYGSQLPDAPEGEVEAVRHYLAIGWRAFADPGPRFSTARYLAENPDVEAGGSNPLIHYLRHGKAEGRRATVDPFGGPARLFRLLPPPTVPTEAEWAALPTKPVVTPSVDIIVPVYKGYAETLRTLYAVLAAPQRTAYCLVVVDDCSPDPALSRALQDLAARGLIDLFRNERNLGFVKSTNRGIGLHPDRDVVLLNADTEVYGNWLDRLRTAVARDPRIATVTPLSNNAEICSYPRFVRDNVLQLELDGASLDRLAAEVNAGFVCDVPTGHGFCMYVRRACLDEVGALDDASFGRGYGEENDLCCRAAAAGWRNVAAGDIFVRHHGSTSFGAEKQSLIAKATEAMAARHPLYFLSVEEFIRNDPIAPARRALDAARLRRRGGPGALLFVLHSLGGGTEKHARELASLIEDAGTAVFFSRPDPARPHTLIIEDPRTPEAPNLRGFRFDMDLGSYAKTLRDIGVSLVHVHNLAGMPNVAADFFLQAARHASVPIDVTLHDYGAICPRVALIDQSGIYCGEPDVQICQRCITRNGSLNGKPDIRRWRASHEALLKGARRVYVPNVDVERRTRRHIAGLRLTVRPHPEPPANRPLKAPDRAPALGLATRRGLPRRIVLLGAVAEHKGSSLLEAVAKLARADRLPLKFIVVGFTDRDDALRAEGVKITGPYLAEEAEIELARAEPDLVWMPSICPETFSFTLSTVLRQRYFPVVFDFGAPAERLRRIGWGARWPLEMMLDPAACAKALVEQKISPAPPIGEALVAYPDPMRSYYGFDPSNATNFCAATGA
jgi:GT2 family glycosyltransferase/glycosyltransferase involved in cell wall biosynthesis